jgi:hypothetical protein
MNIVQWRVPQDAIARSSTRTGATIFVTFANLLWPDHLGECINRS